MRTLHCSVPGRWRAFPAVAVLAMAVLPTFLAFAAAAPTPASGAGAGTTQPGDNGLALALGARIGTAGAGGDLTLGCSDTVNLRLIGQFGTYTYEDTVDEADYDIDFKFSNIGLVLDFHPGGGEFRVSAGIFHNGNDLSGRARPTDNVDLGGVDFPPQLVGTLKADVDFSPVAGYVGIGFGNAVGDRRVTVSLDLGLLFFAAPEFDLSADGPLAGNRFFEAQLRKEEQDIEDEFVSRAHWWPMLALGLSVRF